VKLLVVVHDYLPFHVAGTELHAHQSGAQLAARGHDVTALFTERDLSREVGSIRRGELDGVKTIEVIHQREYADVRETYLEEDSARIFRELLAELEPDVVHFHHFAFWGAECAAIAREAGCRVIATLHDYHLLCDNSVLLRRDGSLCTDGPRGGCHECLERHPVHPERGGSESADDAYRAAKDERRALHASALGHVHRVVCPSHFLAGLFVEAGWLESEQILVMKAGYPGPRREAQRTDPAAPLRVGFVGGVYRSKGVHVLVDAFSQLVGTPAELSIHGALDWFPDYVDELRESAKGSQVSFPGRFEPAQLDEILSGLDLLVVPSIWYENMPITLQEAFRNSIPVVASNLGGMSEAVEHEVSGLLVEPGDSSALASAIRRLADDRELLHRLARGTPEPPSLEQIASELESVYEL